MRKTGITGPVFISIGDSEKLNIFLESNPNAPKELFLVDDYTFTAYNAMGFGKIAENAELSIKGTKNMKKPDLGLKKWMSYLKNVSKLAPIPKDLKFGQIPEGVGNKV